MSVVVVILPVFLVIVLGYCLRHFGVFAAEFWRGAEMLVYRVLLPILLFYSIANSQLNIAQVAPLVVAVVIATLSVSAFLWFMRARYSIENAEFASIFQGAVHANVGYVGMPCVLALYGLKGVAIYAMMIAFIVPFINILVVTMLSILSTQKIFHPLKILKNVLTSPQVLACLLGMLWLISGFPLPKVFASALNLVANASAPIGLMVVGAALNIKAVRGYEWPMILSSVTKLLLMPLSVMVLISWFGVSGLAAQVVVLYATLPAAAAATVLAARFGGNVPMASAIVTLETIVSMLSIPLLIQLARALFPT